MNTAKKPAIEATSIEYAKDILKKEAEALEGLAALLDDNFEAALNIILDMETNGRLVVSGMGKAGFIAMKISATFASTGVSSFFLHPAEAVHGDLGRYSNKDIALILSNSGETEEILKLIPHLKRRGCPIISMTSKADSNLAKHADINLAIGEWKEAGPLGLAPTTSTTVMLALGDALAMAVQNRQNFTREEFAFYHPGGNLGRSLLLCSEIMRQNEEHCVVGEDLKTREVLNKISSTKGRPGAATIVDKEQKLSGIFTDGNLRRCLNEEDNFLDAPISQLMTKNPKTVKDTQLAQEAMQVLSHHKIDQVIVVNQDNEPVGLIDIQDLVAIR